MVCPRDDTTERQVNNWRQPNEYVRKKQIHLANPERFLVYSFYYGYYIFFCLGIRVFDRYTLYDRSEYWCRVFVGDRRGKGENDTPIRKWSKLSKTF